MRARQVLGPVFPIAAAAYRRAFVDLKKVAAAVPKLPAGSLLLDVGGGDGALLNPLLDLQPSLRVVMVDIAPSIGIGIRADLRSRVDMRPTTALRDYLDTGGERPGAVLLSDVLHHVPIGREQFVCDILDAFEGNPLIVVKDIEPNGLRARSAFAADRYVSGDRNVVPISRAETVSLFRSAKPELSVTETDLYQRDRPNYCLIFH